MDAQGLAEFLQNYGGWGMTAVLLIGITWMYKNQRDVQNNMGSLLEKRHDQFIDVLKECGAALMQTKETNRDIELSMTRNKEIMDRVERQLAKLED